jgi:uncharacterized membrane protein HdeD (DUF308 family)
MIITKPRWLRILQIIIGIAVIVLSFLVIFRHESTIGSLIYTLSIGLVFIGIERIGQGIGMRHPYMGGWSRLGSFVLGLGGIGLGIFVIVYPLIASGILAFILSLGLLLVGVAKFVQGVADRSQSKFSKIVITSAGAFAIVLSITAMVFPSFGLTILTILVTAIVLILGVESLVSGTIGRGFGTHFEKKV